MINLAVNIAEAMGKNIAVQVVADRGALGATGLSRVLMPFFAFTPPIVAAPFGQGELPLLGTHLKGMAAARDKVVEDRFVL